jgi:hemolysin III
MKPAAQPSDVAGMRPRRTSLAIVLEPESSSGEEIANAITHGIGLLASVIALPVLVLSAVEQFDAAQVVACSIYGVSLILLYGASTFYHALRNRRAKRLFRTLDHAAIYVLIAGTYTPFALGALRGPWGWSILVTIWGMAVAGIILKTRFGFGHARLSTAVYLIMGWLAAVAIRPMMQHLSHAGLWWLLGGGLFYTTGVIFFQLDRRMRYGHMVWHIFVLGGSVCHFFAVLWHARG